jgi:hypothetical protein
VKIGVSTSLTVLAVAAKVVTSPPMLIVLGGELMVIGFSIITGFSTVDTFDTFPIDALECED